MTREEMEARCRELIAEILEKAKTGDVSPLVAMTVQHGLARRLAGIRARTTSPRSPAK